MPRKGHTEEQIIYALRQAEGGQKVGDVCREMGISQQAFYSWKKRFAGLGLNELRELRQLREEKWEAQDLGCGSESGQAHLTGKCYQKGLEAQQARRELVSSVRQAYGVSEKRACELIGITRWTNRYRSRRDGQADLRMRLQGLAGTRTRYGYRRLTVLLRAGRSRRSMRSLGLPAVPGRRVAGAYRQT